MCVFNFGTPEEYGKFLFRVLDFHRTGELSKPLVLEFLLLLEPLAEEEESVRLFVEAMFDQPQGEEERLESMRFSTFLKGTEETVHETITYKQFNHWALEAHHVYL